MRASNRIQATQKIKNKMSSHTITGLSGENATRCVPSVTGLCIQSNPRYPKTVSVLEYRCVVLPASSCNVDDFRRPAHMAFAQSCPQQKGKNILARNFQSPGLRLSPTAPAMRFSRPIREIVDYSAQCCALSSSLLRSCAPRRSAMPSWTIRSHGIPLPLQLST